VSEVSARSCSEGSFVARGESGHCSFAEPHGRQDRVPAHRPRCPASGLWSGAARDLPGLCRHLDAADVRVGQEAAAIASRRDLGRYEELANQTMFVQTGLFAVEVALFRLLSPGACNRTTLSGIRS